MKEETSCTVYGIRNCDTVKKALKWLDEHGVAYTFHDFKSKGITAARLKKWTDQKGWEALVNKKGLTWKQLPQDVRESVKSNSSAVKLMQEKTSVIKRPVVERNEKIEALGFEAEVYAKLFS